MNQSSEVSQEPPRRWAPSPLFYGSAALHMGAAVAALLRPAAWPWALGAVAVNHAVLAATGLWPRSHWLGPNWTQLPDCNGAVVAVTIDDGPDPQVTPQVLEILEKHRAVATFFCVGERVLEHADIAQEIVRRGHTVENHSQRHRHNFSLLGPKGMGAEIARAQESIERVTGLAPRFFRRPRGPAQSISGSGAHPLEPDSGELDAARVRYRRSGSGYRARSIDRRLGRTGYPAAARRTCGAKYRGQVPVILDVLPALLDALTLQQLETITLRAARVEPP